MALMWFRRDLRIHDNPALNKALELRASKAVYISTPAQWSKHNVAPIQVDLMRRHLELLSEQLSELGIELYHLKASDFQSQIQALKHFCIQNDIQTVCANREPEINELNRDKALHSSAIQFNIYNCDTIMPVGSVLNKQQQMYKVFTPFKKAWLRQLQQTGIKCVTPPDSGNRAHSNCHATHSPSLFNAEFDYPYADSSHWPLSDYVMQSIVPDFLQCKLANYPKERDFPAINATSHLSPYLAIGAISPRWLATQLLQNHPELIYDTSECGFAWLNELIWRDFYKHLLFYYPNLAKGKCFQPRYQNIAWQGNPAHFQAWCKGRTGYPLVDAAMTQLAQTGWMHNRLRMVVASFLTKHLLVDWRLGEQFFMSHLIDGDLSANNGGWQWAASTGCDAQPYFRIFNPITQSEKFDPNGCFIRKYLPELSDIPNKYIHFPHQYLKSHGYPALYCSPIVEHKDARLRALALFKQYQ